jgi:hypothetical protein
VALTGDAFQRKNARVKAGETITVDFGVGNATISGSVTRSGQPMPGVGILLLGSGGRGFSSFSDETTNETGAYRFEDVEPGSYTLSLTEGAGSDASGRYRFEVQVPEGVPEVRKDIELPETRLAGTVLDAESGAPVAQASVRASLESPGEGAPAGAGRWASGETGYDGMFRIGLPQPGSWKLEVRHPEYPRERFGPYEVADGDELSGIVLEVEKGNALSGIVRNEGGGIVAMAVVNLRAPEGGNLGSTLTDQGGRFRMSGLPEGEIRAVVAGAGLAPRVLDGLRPGEEVEIVLRRGGSLEVRVEAPDALRQAGRLELRTLQGVELMSILGSVGRQAGIVDNKLRRAGVVRFHALDEGSYTVTFRSGGATASASVTVHTDQHAEAELKL